MPGDDDPPNFMRWALSRYCYDHRGQVLPAMVDAMDRWPMELFEQVTGIGIEKSDLAAAWQDHQHQQVRVEAEKQAALNALRPRR